MIKLTLNDANYEVYVATMKDDLGLDMSSLYMCVSFRFTCMQNMMFLSVDLIV